MKTIPLTLFIITSFFGKSLSLTKYDNQYIDSLLPFNILYQASYYSGNIATQLRIYQKGNQFFATDQTSHNYCDGTKDTAWTTELDSDKINLCKQFIKKAIFLSKTKCPDFSSDDHQWTSFYDINFDTFSLHINGDCNWDTLDYFGLREALFKQKKRDEKLRNESCLNSIHKKLSGKWFFNSSDHEFKSGDFFDLNRPYDFNSECSWEFTNDSVFKNTCNDEIDLSFSNKYELIWLDDVRLRIETGYFTNPDKTVSIGNDGWELVIVELSNKTLRLKVVD